MTEIIIIGEENETSLENMIKNELSKTYGITYIKGSEICGTGGGYELICFDCAKPEFYGEHSAVIIAKSSAVIPQNIPENCTLILNAENLPQLEAAAKSGAYAVDCGHSPQCTVSFTGSSEETLVVSLNRKLTALSGREIQPLEIPVPRKYDDYTLMSFIALRLLLDDHESELGKLM